MALLNKISDKLPILVTDEGIATDVKDDATPTIQNI